MYEELEPTEPLDITWVPLPADQMKSIIGIGLHTGLRKGTDAPEADALWKAIGRSDQAWDDALVYLVDSLNDMGLWLCEKDEEL